MEFLVKNRVFEDFKIEFLPKIEFFDFWPNRVFVKSHKKKSLETLHCAQDLFFFLAENKTFELARLLLYHRRGGFLLASPATCVTWGDKNLVFHKFI